MPLGRVVIVSVTAPLTVIVMLIGPVVVPCGVELSTTSIVTPEVPACVGVPLTVQPRGVSANPAGRTPDVIVQVYGVVPPVMPIGWLYGTPTVPLGRVVNVSLTAPFAVMVTLNGPVTLCCGFDASVAVTVRFEVPAVVGVPLTVQPRGVSVNPAGNDPVVIEHV